VVFVVVKTNISARLELPFNQSNKSIKQINQTNQSIKSIKFKAYNRKKKNRRTDKLA